MLTLPRGSLWRSARIPHGEWGEERECAADVVDAVWSLIQLHATGSTKDAPRTVRPQDMRERDRERARVADAKRRLAETEWEDE